MSPASTVQTLLTRLHAPTQDLVSLSFCNGNKEAHVLAWVNSLPLTQINFVSTQLYKALPEISRLQTQPETRLGMLETLRSPVQQSIQGLAQTFLNQPLILPDAARKTATIAQALQKHMSNGYLVVVRELCAGRRQSSEETIHLKALAIHRAITGLGLLLLRSYQLYAPISGQLWVELHSLYSLAETLELIELPVDDPLPHHRGVTTIRQAYVRLLLLACARPNQLRQDEVVATYHALENLSALGQLLPGNTDRKDNLFAVLLDSNQPPFYKSRLAPGANENLRELNSNPIASKLEEQVNLASNSSNSAAGRNAFDLSLTLTDHLIHAWNILAQRSFERRPANGKLEVTVGLSNIHFHITDGIPFNIFLDQTQKISHGADKQKIFQQRSAQLKYEGQKASDDDPWGEAFDVSGNTLAGGELSTSNIELSIRQREQHQYRGHHPVYQIPLIDTSPGGYCLEWHDEIPVQVKAGELLGLREAGRQKWNVGVVRWVQQTRNSTQLGIQVLAPTAVAVGIAVVQKTGGFSEYLRALQLPALKAVNQPATLLTNAISFREYNKVRVYYAAQRPGESQPEELNLQLTQKLFSTGAFCQFTFREIAGAKPDTSADDFDAVWKK
jgi:hypothetical protein